MSSMNRMHGMIAGMWTGYKFGQCPTIDGTLLNVVLKQIQSCGLRSNFLSNKVTIHTVLSVTKKVDL